MSESDILRSPEQTQAALELLKRKDSLSNAELDEAMAHMAFRGVHKLPDGSVEVEINGAWKLFSPMSNKADIVEVLERVEMVVATHNAPSLDDPDAKIWYSTHAYLNGTSAESYSFSQAVAKTCLQLLEVELSYSPVWQRHEISTKAKP